LPNRTILDIKIKLCIIFFMRMQRIIIFSLLFLCFLYTKIPAESVPDTLDVRLFIVGPGDPVYSFWGHTGLAIRDRELERDVFFDFGNFYFEDDDFFQNFAVGRLLYMAYVVYTEPYIRSIVRDNRELTEYVLNLSPEKERALYEALIDKSSPANRTFLYHHYYDNCSTRIRDYINDATEGAFKEQSEAMNSSSYRESFLRFTSRRKLIGSTLSLLQGTPIDREITLWEEMFLPEVMGDFVKDFQYVNDAGETIPLVSEINVLNGAENRRPVPDSYKHPIPQALIIGLILSALILLVKIKGGKEKRGLYGAIHITAALLIGTLGSLLLFLAAFTDHSYSYNNLNLFMINPLAFFIVPASILYIRKGKPWQKRMEILWLIQFVSTLLMIALKILTPLRQDNLVEILVFLPVLFALSPLAQALFRKLNLLGKIPDPSLQSGNLTGGSQ